MSELKGLSSRSDDEFAAVEKVKDLPIERLRQHRERWKRLEQLNQVFQKVAEAWKPRLDSLMQKFGDRVQVTPRLTPSSREATFECQSNQGRVRLRFSAATDPDVSKVILGCDLEVIPVVCRCEPHAELEFPLDRVNEAAAALWVHDRIVAFVRAYLSLHEDERSSR